MLMPIRETTFGPNMMNGGMSMEMSMETKSPTVILRAIMLPRLLPTHEMADARKGDSATAIAED